MTLTYIIIGLSINVIKIDGITDRKIGNTQERVIGITVHVEHISRMTAIYGILPRKLHLNETIQTM